MCLCCRARTELQVRCERRSSALFGVFLPLVSTASLRPTTAVQLNARKTLPHFRCCLQISLKICFFITCATAALFSLVWPLHSAVLYFLVLSFFFPLYSLYVHAVHPHTVGPLTNQTLTLCICHIYCRIDSKSSCLELELSRW